MEKVPLIFEGEKEKSLNKDPQNTIFSMLFNKEYWDMWQTLSDDDYKKLNEAFTKSKESALSSMNELKKTLKI